MYNANLVLVLFESNDTTLGKIFLSKQEFFFLSFWFFYKIKHKLFSCFYCFLTWSTGQLEFQPQISKISKDNKYFVWDVLLAQLPQKISQTKKEYFSNENICDGIHWPYFNWLRLTYSRILYATQSNFRKSIGHFEFLKWFLKI